MKGVDDSTKFDVNSRDPFSDYYRSMNKGGLESEIGTYVKNGMGHEHLKEMVDFYLDCYGDVLRPDEVFRMRLYRGKSMGSVAELERLVAECSGVMDDYAGNDNSRIKDVRDEAVGLLQKMYVRSSKCIPKIVHFIYLYQRELRSYNYKCMQSVLECMKGYDIYIHNDIEPKDPAWALFTANPNVFVKKVERVKKFDGFDVEHVQYEADIIRIDVLFRYGGIYLDMDVLMLKSIDDGLLMKSKEYGLYLAKENDNNIINCVIISEPENGFLMLWKNAFRYGLRMGVWGWHIRDLPRLMLNKYTYLVDKFGITVMDYRAFCPVYWTDSGRFDNNVIEELRDDERVYGVHLFETILGSQIEKWL